MVFWHGVLKPLAYTSHMVFPNVCVFLTFAPLDVFVGKLKTTDAHLPISLSGQTNILQENFSCAKFKENNM
jgi:hypothetical protein